MQPTRNRKKVLRLLRQLAESSVEYKHHNTPGIRSSAYKEMLDPLYEWDWFYPFVRGDAKVRSWKKNRKTQYKS